MWEINGCGASIPASSSRGHAARIRPADVAVARHVWVTGQITNKLYKIDRSTGRVVRAFSVGREPMGVAVGAGAVWVANKIDGTISKSTRAPAKRSPSPLTRVPPM